MALTSDGEPMYVSDETVRALVDEQFPHLADRELGRRYTLEDQFAIRLGDDFGAIFPRHADRDAMYARATELVAGELRHWTFPSSHPIATGQPGHGFPWHWVLVPWISASTAGFVPLHAEAARDLGDAVRQIHRPAPAGAPVNPRTGPSLADCEEDFEAHVTFALERGAPENRVLDAEGARRVFAEGRDRRIDVQPSWTHGRLEPRALLSDRGRFAGVLLWHNFGAGDPAADLGMALNVISLDAQTRFWAGYGTVSVDTRARVVAHQVYAALCFIRTEDPFLERMAWERLIELGLAHEA